MANYQLSQEVSNSIKKYIIPLIIIFIVLVLFQRFNAIIISMLLIIIGTLSIFWKRFINISLGFELITFVTIIFCFTISPLFAMVAAAIMTTVGSILNGRLCIPMFVQIAAYIIISVISIPLLGTEIVTAGILLALIFNIILHSSYIFMFGFNPINSLMSFVFNMLLNIFMFTRYAPGLT